MVPQRAADLLYLTRAGECPLRVVGIVGGLGSHGQAPAGGLGCAVLLGKAAAAAELFEPLRQTARPAEAIATPERYHSDGFTRASHSSEGMWRGNRASPSSASCNASGSRVANLSASTRNIDALACT